MTAIDISFETYKKLTLLRQSEKDSYDSVIQRLLSGGQHSTSISIADDAGATMQATHTNKVKAEPGDWVTHNTRFPKGTKFRGKHGGAYYYAIVKDGALYYENQRFDSPSGAATKIRGYNQNGWKFWECNFPGTDTWIKMMAYYDGTEQP